MYTFDIKRGGQIAERFSCQETKPRWVLLLHLFSMPTYVRMINSKNSGSRRWHQLLARTDVLAGRKRWAAIMRHHSSLSKGSSGSHNGYKDSQDHECNGERNVTDTTLEWRKSEETWHGHGQRDWGRLFSLSRGGIGFPIGREQ